MFILFENEKQQALGREYGGSTKPHVLPFIRGSQHVGRTEVPYLPAFQMSMTE